MNTVVCSTSAALKGAVQARSTPRAARAVVPGAYNVQCQGSNACAVLGALS